jgi:hypothetical protein
VRRLVTAVVLVALLFAAFIVGRASEPEETAITVLVTSADHEIEEGYFSLGDNATLMVKPGTDFYRFLANRKGRQIRITLAETGRGEPSRLER